MGPEDLELGVMAALEEDDGQRHLRENRSHLPEMPGMHEAQNRTEKDPDGDQQQDVRDPGPPEQGHEGMRQEDHQSDECDDPSGAHGIDPGFHPMGTQC
jgi:hypothetical protein